MIYSPYATQFTREHIAGKKDPQRNMTNRKALERPSRRAAWLAKNEE